MDENRPNKASFHRPSLHLLSTLAQGWHLGAHQHGLVEMDLVGHDGGDAQGDYRLTLDLTDVKTGWTECVAVRNKAQKYVFEAIRLARRRLPFPLLGVDSDNGSEFINDELFRYCRDERITFTRGRSGHKNDNAYVEQKNWSAVRRFVGDLRYDTPAQLKLLNQLYKRLHLYLNFFIPEMKLKEKVRTSSKVKRVYHEPQMPYARVLASADVSAKIKAQLKPEIDELVDQLWQDPRRS